nr:unnamed protein product [Callosobruchus chinensis]
MLMGYRSTSGGGGGEPNLARVDSSSPLCWSQAQEKREGWKPHFCKTTHTQNPQRNTTHRHQPRNSDLFKFFRGRTPGLIAWAVAMNKPGSLHSPVAFCFLREKLGQVDCLSTPHKLLHIFKVPDIHDSLATPIVTLQPSKSSQQVD